MIKNEFVTEIKEQDDTIQSLKETVRDLDDSFNALKGTISDLDDRYNKLDGVMQKLQEIILHQGSEISRLNQVLSELNMKS